MEDKPDGYYIPIHKSLVDPILIGGIDAICAWHLVSRCSNRCNA